MRFAAVLSECSIYIRNQIFVLKNWWLRIVHECECGRIYGKRKKTGLNSTQKIENPKNRKSQIEIRSSIKNIKRVYEIIMMAGGGALMGNINLT